MSDEDDDEGSAFETASRIFNRVSPALERMQQKGESPLRMLGRIAGLGNAEMDAGIPKWAWLGVGVVVGATVTWVWGDKAKSLTGRFKGRRA